METPWEGPGYSEASGYAAGTPGTVLVALTNGKLKSDGGARDRFNGAAQRVLDTIDQSDGFIAQTTRGTITGDEVWTMSLWRDEDAMLGFVTADAHMAAMDLAPDVFAAARFYQYAVSTAQPAPTWSEAITVFDANVPELSSYGQD